MTAPDFDMLSGSEIMKSDEAALSQCHSHNIDRDGETGRPGVGPSSLAGWRSLLLLTAIFTVWLWVVPAAAQSQTDTGPQTQQAENGTTLEQAVQLLPSPIEQNAGPPLTLTLTDALARAQKNSPQFQSAVTDAKLAREAHKQAGAAMKPSLSYRMDYLNTQGDGISPGGRFVTNDGVHVYRAWAVARQDMPGSFFIGAGTRKAAYDQAVALAAQEVAKRSLTVTVTQDYYALLVAERDYATAQKSLDSARRFLKIANDLEQGGEVAHADVIRFQLQANQSERDLEEAELTMSQARLNLSVLMFPTFNENFTVVDDMDTPPELPAFGEAETMAKNRNPEVASALASYRSAGVEVASAKAAFFPSLSVEFDYGIEANALALHSDNTTKPGVVQPNLGYFVTYSLNLPIWDWGSRWSQLHQAEDKKELAHLNLSFAQRQALSNLYAFYDEAKVARSELMSLRQSVELADQNLNLVTLQYKAGEAAVLQVLDAETALTTARNTYATGEARYRTALATLQTITGSF
ncbi:MAG TPA: TolC family protein [Candidatus Acidoferrales bacterium]|nr:TolC family protein [Candidatus Acidoferrales bacterium]